MIRNRMPSHLGRYLGSISSSFSIASSGNTSFSLYDLRFMVISQIKLFHKIIMQEIQCLAVTARINGSAPKEDRHILGLLFTTLFTNLRLLAPESIFMFGLCH